MENSAKVENGYRKQILAILGMILGGFLLLALLIGGLSADSSVASEPASVVDWDEVFSEDFESGLSAGWVITDQNGPIGGEYYWFTTTYTSSGGIRSVWATGGGADGSQLDPSVDLYPDNALSWMIYGPVDLTGTTSARLSFDYWLETQPSFDPLAVMASTDGTAFSLLDAQSGDSGGWQARILDLDDYAGEDQVWIAFFFSSNGDGIVGRGVFVDNVVLESLSEQTVYFPLIEKEPTPTPSPTPVYGYFDDFSDPGSGWPIVYNPNPQDWFHWYYENGTYKLDIGDDRTDVKASPGVELPNGDYVVEVDGRFRWYDPGVLQYWTSYGIIFDGKDDPDPGNSDLGDYFMLWILWEGPTVAKWTILNDMNGGAQENVGGWRQLPGSVYDYGNNGLNWNHWKIVRTDNSISVYCNDTLLETLNCGPSTLNCVRPRDNYQVLFGLFGSTYETGQVNLSWDNYLVELAGGSVGSWNMVPRGPVVVSGDLELDALLPQPGE